MIYSLWDVAIGNAVAEYSSDIEMAHLVRVLVGENGPSTADDLDLSINRNDLTQVGSLTGKDLVAWAEGILAGHGESGARLGKTPPSGSHDSRDGRQTGKNRGKHNRESPAARRDKIAVNALKRQPSKTVG